MFHDFSRLSSGQRRNGQQASTRLAALHRQIDRPAAAPPLVTPWFCRFRRSPRPRDLMPSFPFIASLALFQCSNKEAGKN